ncbi:hypothetical protein Gogos_010205 [Gossypium gossypioides]|uniref:Uncharacterized protein n=1 Tax=Gossypium gossypioides TaxID=34282 RepID=A0A7J9BKF8_GOSGO|nr:hypothetical protein [Gossypium gossypioides]
MDNKACNKMQTVVSKAKKKQVKDELERIKQAEKKKRRLEKALATSAAIRSELEKKKQKKKEEQQRLDEEGAAIAEAVALHVLLGEDSDDSANIMLNKEEGFNCWGYGIYMDGERAYLPHQPHPNCQGWVSNAYRTGDGDWSFSYGREVQAPFLENGGLGSGGLSVGLIAAQAISALQITEDSKVLHRG